MKGFGETILIERGKLLNFWRAGIVMEHPNAPGRMLTYPTVEHRFQAMKTIAMVFDGSTAIVHDAIARAANPHEAKRMGRELQIDADAWDAISYDEMMKANQAKFEQHPDLLEELLATGFARLVEHRPDPVWGDNMDGSGKNLQGKVLMTVRANLRPLDLSDVQLRMIIAALVEARTIKARSLVGYDYNEAASFVRQAETAILVQNLDSAPAREVLRIAELIPTSE
jgi:ribA/ribD-fused uncharacterized protein